MGNIFDQKNSGGSSGGGGNIFDSKGSAPKTKKRGLLGTIGHDIAATSEGFAHKAAGIGPGAVALGGLFYHGTKSALTGDTQGLHQFNKSLKTIGTETAHQTVNDFAHPHGDFSGAALDLLTLASLGAGAAARGAAVGRAAKAGETATDVLKAAVRAPKPEARVIKVPGSTETVHAGTYSRAASSRAVQKGLDKLREKYPNVHFTLRNQHQRIGHERAINARYEERIANFDNRALLAKTKGLNKAQQFAIQVVNEKVPLETRIADAQKMLADAPNPRVAKMLSNHLRVLDKVKTYVEDVNGLPRLKADQAKLEDVYAHAKRVADKRTADLVDAGMLKQSTAEGALARVSGYYNAAERGIKYEGTDVSKAAKLQGQINMLKGLVAAKHLEERRPFVEKYGGVQQKIARLESELARINGQLTLDHNFNADAVPELTKSDFFISYRNAKNPQKLTEPPQVGAGQSVGIPRRLSELSHGFTGESIRTGNINPKAVEKVAVDSQRANKVIAVWRQRDELGRIAADRKLTENHIPIRPIWLKNKKWPQEVKDAIDRLQQDLTPDEELKVAQKLHDYIFPEKDVSIGASAKGVKWIDRRYLGNLNLPKTLGAAEKIGRVADKVNTPFRAATLFKPGYVPANLGNNLFINVINGAVHDLPRAARISRELGEDAVKIDALMGEGKTASVGQAAGLGRNLNEAANKVQRGLGKLVDVVPRRAAFLHEAERAGFRTTADVRRLLNDESLRPTLIRVAREANSEMIDYANLGPAEQAFVRRVIFLYPWVKGATMYGGRFLKEHPVKAGVFGQVGALGNAEVKRTLGDVPSYGLGLVKVGNYVVNTEPLNNFPQAGQELQVVVGLMQKHPLQSAQILAQASPVVQAMFSPSTGKSAPDTLAGASLVRLAQEAISPNKAPQKVYPGSRQDALLRFLVGSVAPRKVNIDSLHAQAAREKSGR